MPVGESKGYLSPLLLLSYSPTRSPTLPHQLGQHWGLACHCWICRAHTEDVSGPKAANMLPDSHSPQEQRIYPGALEGRCATPVEMGGENASSVLCVCARVCICDFYLDCLNSPNPVCCLTTCECFSFKGACSSHSPIMQSKACCLGFHSIQGALG